MMALPVIIVDLEADYLVLLHRELYRMGIVVPPEVTTIAETSYIFWNAKKRRIPAAPRRVHLAREFRMPGEDSDRAGAELLLQMFRDGEDVNPHLSWHATNPKRFPREGERHKPDPFHDGLLNHWDIQHFHWDEGTDSTRVRSSMMLFATVKPNDVYVIDVLDHGLWARQDLLDRVHRNWPFLLKRFEQPEEGKQSRVQRLTDQQVATLRRRGYNAAFTALDGTQYFPPGGGQVPARIGLDVVMRASRAAGVVSHWNAAMKKSHEVIADLFERHGAPVPENVTLKLEIDDGDMLHVVEPTFGFRITLGPLFPPS
jgi:hypothetical protein